MDYCTAGPQYASGGFIADSKLPAVTNGSQQQWLTRNSEVAELVQRRVEPGLLGRRSARRTTRRSRTRRTPRWTPPRSAGRSPTCSSTARATTTSGCRRPSTTRSGITWANGLTPGRTLPLSDFFVAKPSDPVLADQRANCALRQEPAAHARRVRHRRTASTCSAPEHGRPRHRARHAHRRQRRDPDRGRQRARRDRGRRDLRRRPQDVAGPAAGRHASTGRLQLGGQPDARCPTCTSASAARTSASADTALEVNSDNVLIDHTWVWRADHGVEGFTDDPAVEHQHRPRTAPSSTATT